MSEYASEHRTTRRFPPGWSATVAGIRFRTAPGRRHGGQNDQILEWCVDQATDEWQPTPVVALSALFTDFMYENEERLIPREQRPKSWKGGRKWLDDAIKDAIKHGYEYVIAKVEVEKRQARLPV